jgi:hypothetical protein
MLMTSFNRKRSDHGSWWRILWICALFLPKDRYAWIWAKHVIEERNKQYVDSITNRRSLWKMPVHHGAKLEASFVISRMEESKQRKPKGRKGKMGLASSTPSPAILCLSDDWKQATFGYCCEFRHRRFHEFGIKLPQKWSRDHDWILYANALIWSQLTSCFVVVKSLLFELWPILSLDAIQALSFARTGNKRQKAIRRVIFFQMLWLWGDRKLWPCRRQCLCFAYIFLSAVCWWPALLTRPCPCLPVRGVKMSRGCFMLPMHASFLSN